ncbi:MAG: hypothetical protein QME64_01695 [bacterium]|nr:hypothetical protein [bacterium]
MPNNVDQNQLIQLLIDEKLLNKRQLKNALAEQQKTGKSLSQVLIDMRLVTKGVLAELEARTLGVEQIRLLDQTLDPAILTLIPRRMAEQYRAVPVRLSGDALTIAMENPHDVLALDDIKLHTGKAIKPVLCSNKDIDYALKHYPDGGEIPVIAIGKPAKIVQMIAIFIFVLAMFAPLLLLLWLIYRFNEVVIWISDYNNLFIVLLWWGFYSIILYWGYGIFFEKKKEKPKSVEPR